MKIRTTYLNRFTIDMPLETALDCSAPGQDATESVRAALWETSLIRDQLDAIGATEIRRELAEYGVWDSEELENDEENKERIVWISAGNIREEEAH